MKYSILHISDLHRIKTENIDCIMSSFLVEKTRFEEMGLPPVKLIVVSGDIVDGSKEQDADLAKGQIDKQYETATLFLNELCTLFIGTNSQDRRNLVIVPGNHDVSRYVSERSMEQINHDEKEIEELADALWSDEADIRWSWKTLHFNKINDRNTYNTRFDDFIRFYDSFFAGIREFPKDPDRQSYLIDIPELNIAFACFNSCYQLDHLRLSGYISPRSLSALTRSLLEAKQNGRLLVGVWHHHTHGLPNENNYLDYSILDNMVQNGIFIALHGHQHISGIVNEYKDVFSEDKLKLISAGTLYGNTNDLPPAKTRQYNLLVAETFEDHCDITLYSREDSTALNVMPAWDAGTIGRSRKTSYKFTIPVTPHQSLEADETLQNSINSINLEVEKTGDIERGVNKLIDLGMEKVLVRKFVLEMLQRDNNNQTIIDLFIEPVNNNEAIAVVESCIKSNNKVALRKVLDSLFVKSSSDASLKSLITEAKFLLK